MEALLVKFGTFRYLANICIELCLVYVSLSAVKIDLQLSYPKKGSTFESMYVLERYTTFIPS
jgi:hypothetical protein